MKQVNKNPTSNANITPLTFPITSTGASGTVSITGDVSSLTKGQSVLLLFTGGTAQGFTNKQEYFVIPVGASSFRIADSKELAMDGTYLTSASGNAGVGTVYPIYQVGGVMTVNTAGNVYIRGLNNSSRGTTSFSLQTVEVNGSIIPYMIKDVSTSGLTASNLVSWCD